MDRRQMLAQALASNPVARREFALLPGTETSRLMSLATPRTAFEAFAGGPQRPASILDPSDPVTALAQTLPAEPAPYGTEMTPPSREFDPLLPSRETGGIPMTASGYSRMRELTDLALNFAGTTPMRGVAGIRAYHGSPHDFDRFDMRRIGTGEGAQAYGHGLYFAQNEDVARAYRDALARPTNVYIDGKPWTGSGVTPAQARVLNFIENAGDFATARDQMVSAIMNAPEDAARAVLGRDLQALDDLAPRVTMGGPFSGRMYEVNLRVDPNRLLDWDAPLSQQAPEVRDAIGRTPWGDAYTNSSLTGGQIAPRTAEGAQQLREAGIPGIRYLDQGSRGNSMGTRNYVMFDDSLIEILRKYGLAGLGVGLGASVATQADAADARP